MGEARRKQHNRQQFLLDHPWCIYCGAAATTTDHCPPRCFFVGRQWPETYKFPACEPCNLEAKHDEQALAALTRIDLTEVHKEPGKTEWEKLVRGVRNNQAAIVAEWQGISQNRQKRSIREAFGEDGDHMRRAGWGAINLGPLTHAATERFMIKLGKALHYRHNGTLFDGVIYAKHINVLAKNSTLEFMDDVLRMAPELSDSRRNSQSLTDQFIYRFNHSQRWGVLYAIVEFSAQFVFQIMALSQEMADELAARRQGVGQEMPTQGRYPCPLKHKPAAQ